MCVCAAQESVWHAFARLSSTSRKHWRAAHLFSCWVLWIRYLAIHLRLHTHIDCTIVGSKFIVLYFCGARTQRHVRRHLLLVKIAWASSNPRCRFRCLDGGAKEWMFYVLAATRFFFFVFLVCVCVSDNLSELGNVVRLCGGDVRNLCQEFFHRHDGNSPGYMEHVFLGRYPTPFVLLTYFGAQRHPNESTYIIHILAEFPSSLRSTI